MYALRMGRWMGRLPTASSAIGVRQWIPKHAFGAAAATLQAEGKQPRRPLVRKEVTEDPEEVAAKGNSEEQRQLAISSILGEDTESDPQLQGFGKESDGAMPTKHVDLMAGISDDVRPSEPYHFHVFSHRHNTHVTLTGPDRNPIISKSAGNIGFRHASRGSYDAAYQLAAYVLNQIYDGGLLAKVDKVEVVLRGFGIGREAVTKALMGVEGRRLRDRIVRVSDGTRLKQGGTRSKAPRRL